MPDNSFLLEFLSLGLVLHHLLIPILIKLRNFFNMGHLNLALLVLLLADNLLPSLLVELDPHLHQPLLGQIRFHVLALLLPLLLMRVEDFPMLAEELHVFLEILPVEIGQALFRHSTGSALVLLVDAHSKINDLFCNPIIFIKLMPKPPLYNRPWTPNLLASSPP